MWPFHKKQKPDEIDIDALGIPPEFRGRGEVMLGFAESAKKSGKFFFYVRIPESRLPVERGELYEDPLDAALVAAEVGSTTGGGSQLGDDDKVAYCGIDVVVIDHAKGLSVIRETMLRLGASPATVIEEYLPKYHEYGLR